MLFYVFNFYYNFIGNNPYNELPNTLNVTGKHRFQKDNVTIKIYLINEENDFNDYITNTNYNKRST